MDNQILFYTNDNIHVSKKVKLALETTLPSEMYQYDFITAKNQENVKKI
jgi:hypothetical protein